MKVDHEKALALAESWVAGSAVVIVVPSVSVVAAAYVEDHAEVARLRAEVERLRATNPDHARLIVAATTAKRERDEARAEVERLREGEAGDYWAVAEERDAERKRAGEYALERDAARARVAELELALGRVSRLAPCVCPTTRPGTCTRCETRALLNPSEDKADDE